MLRQSFNEQLLSGKKVVKVAFGKGFEATTPPITPNKNSKKRFDAFNLPDKDEVRQESFVE